MTKKKATPKTEAAPKESQSKSKAGGNDSAAQRLRAIDLLRTGPKSTLQLRRDGDILAPAARILELKRRGFDILTQWVRQATDCGKLHRVALYVLLRETGGQT
jgi:Helix-turn-helix domain